MTCASVMSADSGGEERKTHLGNKGDSRLAVGAGKELDDVLGESGLEEDLEDDPGRVGGSGGGLPEDDVADEGRCADEVASDGGEAAEYRSAGSRQRGG